MLVRLAGVRHGAAVDRAVGLYQYLGIEILILVALRARLQSRARSRRPAVVRPWRLSSASAPTRSASASSTSSPISGSAWPRRSLAAAIGRRAGGALHLAPARHLLRLHDHRLRPDILVRRDQVAQHHRRRGRAAEDRAAAGRLRRRRRSISQSNVALYYFVLAVFVVVVARCCGGWCIRPSAAWSRRSSRAKPAPRFSATMSGATRPSIFTLSAALSGLAGGLFAMAQLRPFPT